VHRRAARDGSRRRRGGLYARRQRHSASSYRDRPALQSYTLGSGGGTVTGPDREAAREALQFDRENAELSGGAAGREAGRVDCASPGRRKVIADDGVRDTIILITAGH